MAIDNKGQFNGGILTAVLLFIVVAVFLSMSAVTLNGISDQTAGNSSDTSWNVTQNALSSAATFSGFLTPLGLVVAGVLFLSLVVLIGAKFK